MVDGIYLPPFAPFYCVQITPKDPNPDTAESSWAVWQATSPRHAAEVFAREVLELDDDTADVEVRTVAGRHRFTVRAEPGTTWTTMEQR